MSYWMVRVFLMLFSHNLENYYQFNSPTALQAYTHAKVLIASTLDMCSIQQLSEVYQIWTMPISSTVLISHVTVVTVKWSISQRSQCAFRTCLARYNLTLHLLTIIVIISSLKIGLFCSKCKLAFSLWMCADSSRFDQWMNHEPLMIHIPSFSMHNIPPKLIKPFTFSQIVFLPIVSAFCESRQQ